MLGRSRRTRNKLLVVFGLFVALSILPGCTYSPKRAREEELRKDLKVLRDAIDQYTLDQQRAPRTLQDLVDANYLKEIPKDPITLQNDWEPAIEDPPMSVDRNHVGIADVHSHSHKTARDGSTYNSW